MTQGTNPASGALPSPKERRRLREAKSLSEEQVAAAVGVTRATVKNWETGRSSPRGRKLRLYANLLAGTGPEESSCTPDPEPTPELNSRTHPAPKPKQPPATTGPRPAAGRAAEPPTVPACPAPPPSGPPRSDSLPAPPEPPALTPAEAFDALYAYAAPALVRQTYLLTGRRRLSHESVERAFHLAWQRWPEVAVDRDPAGWVRAAAYEHAMSPWQRMRRVHRHPDAPLAEDERRLLLDALLELPPHHRRTLLLYDGVGLDLPDTAAETEASTPAAASRVLHARAALAERMPELEAPETLHDRLTALANSTPAPQLMPSQDVRTGSERRARFWTRVAVAVTTLIIGATAVTLLNAPTRYEPPVSPGREVEGVPPHNGPQKLTRKDIELRARLLSEPVHGPGRLVPQDH
ncbi:DNA-directed RNA polymerase specialized sigma24 family protein [Streptomyces sp. SLBN-118]|uniref:helix-turn-helix domain-containing protein n=1 Tax=Streptomyces sp. SLBN-118 TaxID=2768454 RepID=UPI00115361B0|nr:helix-turn-helix domain-containing protein [Streptomyces sp. SLBN-118]TQK52367.1 DNA-directed RNA polymerase specialized sigma24 family protein [Streptomyces sp. SLBN-118]